MLIEIPYRRDDAVAYAKQWSSGRNPKFYSFDGMGGDCTNFASQCVYAGCGVMNTTPTLGWYYRSPSDRSPSWSGVQYLYNFLTGNRSVGPYAVETDPESVLPGDLVQLGTEDHFYHTPVVVAAGRDGIFVAAHTLDTYLRPLNSYLFTRARYLHIAGARRWG